jgi:beta-lactamase class D
MIRILSSALTALIIFTSAHGETVSTLLSDSDSGRILYAQGACSERATPASTFKIAISVMGYDSGILIDAHQPAWPYREEYKAWREEWKTTVDPTTWLRDSVVWYSRGVTHVLGEARFQHYADAFNYGNHDVAGNPGRHDGLTNAWLSSSLQISPLEQAAFLRKLLHRQLPASAQAQDMTTRIMPAFPLADGWVVHGKTGTGSQQGPDGVAEQDRQLGWFVGWATKGDRHLIFARLIKDDAKIESPAGYRARDSFLADFPKLLKSSLRAAGHSAESKPPRRR